jgi:hypothetical protein
MNVVVETIKVLQTFVVSKRDTNMQLSLELKEAKGEGGWAKRGSRKGHEYSNVKSFHEKGHQGKKGEVMGNPSGDPF